MILKVISVTHNEQTDLLEVVKEITDDDGNVTYHLHVAPPKAIANLVASCGVVNPSDAVDLFLYDAHISDDDDGEDRLTRAKKCKSRMNAVGLVKRKSSTNSMADLPSRYQPLPGEDVYGRIYALANISEETLSTAQEVHKSKGAHNEHRTNQHSTSEGRRQKPRHSHILLGTTD